MYATSLIWREDIDKELSTVNNVSTRQENTLIILSKKEKNHNVETIPTTVWMQNCLFKAFQKVQMSKFVENCHDKIHKKKMYFAICSIFCNRWWKNIEQNLQYQALLFLYRKHVISHTLWNERTCEVILENLIGKGEYSSVYKSPFTLAFKHLTSLSLSRMKL